MVKIILIISFCISMTSSILFAATPLPVQLMDEIRISSSVKVSATIQTIEFSKITPAIIAGRWGADDSPKMQPPKRLIRVFQIRHGEEIIILPASSFSDLCDIRSLKIKKIDKGFEVTIKGGDAGSSYTAILSFVDKKIVKRRVFASETPNNAWEETIYKSEFPKDW